MISIGTAGWSIPKAVRERFPEGGSILERYALAFDAVEINSSFYRPHRPETYARWAASTPDRFRFAVKLPKIITHERRLIDSAEPLERFLTETAALGCKRGPILIQLPPSLRFDAATVERFLDLLRSLCEGDVAIEPRHVSWFAPEVEALLTRRRIARVAADPAVCEAAAHPGGWKGFSYWRLHGSPQMYASPYGAERIATLFENLTQSSWVIFDNTMHGAAAEDALLLFQRTQKPHALLPSHNPDAKLDV